MVGFFVFLSTVNQFDDDLFGHFLQKTSGSALCFATTRFLVHWSHRMSPDSRFFLNLWPVASTYGQSAHLALRPLLLAFSLGLLRTAQGVHRGFWPS